MAYFYLIAGLVILVFGGDYLVKGAVNFALRYNISTLVIGMTIVSFGTSAPELFVSLKSNLSGHPEIAVGNVIGSNIANIALVLGITTLVFPIQVKRKTVYTDWPFMFGVSVLFYFFIQNGVVSQVEGGIYVVLLLAYNIFLFVQAAREGDDQELEVDADANEPIWKSVFFIVAGAIGLALGADWLVRGAETIAKSYGVSERIIGVTIVAFGTSLPELITSVVAAYKKEMDISVGNLIGSNVFNLLGVIGITSLVKPLTVTAATIQGDIYWMLGIALLLFPFMAYKFKVDRVKGSVLLAFYLYYMYVVIF